MFRLVSCFVVCGCFVFGFSSNENESRVLKEIKFLKEISGENTTLENINFIFNNLPQNFIKKDELIKLRADFNRSGPYVEYWNNGQKKIEIAYKTGKFNGHVHCWYKNGMDAYKGYYRENLKQGIHIIFYPSDDKTRTFYSKILSFNENGNLEGTQWFLYPNFNLKSIYNFRNGLPSGDLTLWDLEENRIFSDHYYEGQRRENTNWVKFLSLFKKKRKVRPDLGYFKSRFEMIARKEYGLEASLFGASCPYDLCKMTFIFHKVGRLEKEEARKLIVSLKERLLEEINKYEPNFPYLRDYPFPPSRLCLEVDFYNEAGETWYDGKISSVFSGSSGDVLYRASDKKSPFFYVLDQETYEEAKSKI